MSNILKNFQKILATILPIYQQINIPKRPDRKPMPIHAKGIPSPKVQGTPLEDALSKGLLPKGMPLALERYGPSGWENN